MNLTEAWYVIYSERIPELTDEKRMEMARAAAKRGDVPPPSRIPEVPVPSAREVVVGSVGYVGAVEAWDLKRRLVDKGGLSKLLDFWPGHKEQGLNVLGMIGGIGAMATVLLAWLGGGEEAKLSVEALAAGYAAFHLSARAFSARLGADRVARELKAVTIATAAASAPAAQAEAVIAVGNAVAIEAKP